MAAHLFIEGRAEGGEVLSGQAQAGRHGVAAEFREQARMERGYGVEAIRKVLGGNYLRVFSGVM